MKCRQVNSVSKIIETKRGRNDCRQAVIGKKNKKNNYQGNSLTNIGEINRNGRAYR